MGILINGIEYAHEQTIIMINGLRLPSCTALNHDEEQAKENLSGAQVEPYARLKGARNYSGSITIGRSDYENLVQQSEDGATITSIPMGILSYTIFESIPVNVTLKNLEFTRKSGTSGSGNRTEVSLDFIYAGEF